MIEIAIKVKKVNILFNAAKLDILTWESMRIFKVDIRGTAVFLVHVDWLPFSAPVKFN